MGVSSQELNRAIRHKFGSLRKFSDLTGLSYDVVRKATSKSIIAESRRDDIMKLVRQTDNEIASYELSEDECLFIKQGVCSVYVTLKEFSDKHRDWSRSAINDLTNGRRKRFSARVKSLVSHLVDGMRSKNELNGYEMVILDHLVKILESKEEND